MGRGTEIFPKQSVPICHPCEWATLELHPTTLLKTSSWLWAWPTSWLKTHERSEARITQQAAFRFLTQRFCEGKECFLLVSATDYGWNLLLCRASLSEMVNQEGKKREGRGVLFEYQPYWFWRAKCACQVEFRYSLWVRHLGERPGIKPEFIGVPICSHIHFPNSLQFHFYFSEDIFICSKPFVFTTCFYVHWCVTSPGLTNNLQKKYF